MKVYIRNKFISLGGSSTVVDENNQPLYKVKGKFFTFTRKKYIMDMEGNRLFIVRNKWINWFIHTAYIYDGNKKKIARVKDRLFNVHKEYFVEGYKDDISTEGKFFSLSTNVYRNDELIGKISREINLFVDAFELEAEEKDIPFLIALVIAIDNITDQKEAEARKR